MEQFNCYDCQKIIQHDKNQNITNGVLLKYKHEGKEYLIFKCHECYEKNKELTNFNPCDIYSRIVGYIRPINQWNQGKIQELQERKNFNIKE